MKRMMAMVGTTASRRIQEPEIEIAEHLGARLGGKDWSNLERNFAARTGPG
jgi:hypothetical protein